MGRSHLGLSLGTLRVLAAALALLATPHAQAARISDVTNTKHNLSVSGPGPVKATTESQICVFCHTPHAAENEPGAPLWNRQLSGAQYTTYSSNTIDAADIAAGPGGSSKLCLSCHDGTLAIGAVNVANGQSNPTIAMEGTAVDGTMPTTGELTGFTRRLGVDLTNDHPISFTYDSTLASADGELRDPALEGHIASRVPGLRPAVPLENGKLECTSCHDPHIRDDALGYPVKFLRLNRFQIVSPAGGNFSEANDQVCLGCHDKLGQAWAQSAHALSTVADEQYTDGAADTREFPRGIRVWEAACLNCHDTHTVQGARRLLREGTDALGSPKSGGDSAIEETCYQCHTTLAESILTSVAQVPNVKTDFQSTYHMPIVSTDQLANEERHDPNNADGEESPVLLGDTDLNNRHAECTDCHNPHRVLKNRLFNGGGTDAAGTHNHATGHTNIASGVLRGAWGVEPIYPTSGSFHLLPNSYEIRRGDGGIGASTGVGQPYVTREYQICLKCHSDFGYDDNNMYPIGDRPDLGDSGGSTGPTAPDANGLTQYTNQAKEFHSPPLHRGEPVTRTDTGAGAGYSTNNHRSWHPVMLDTGRTAAARDMSASTAMFLSPWNGANIGAQTMYCSDCHGSETANGTVVPNGGEDGSPWGPHGSTHEYILKGEWDNETGTNNSGFCFRCHSYTNYATAANEGCKMDETCTSGYSNRPDDDGNLHAIHAGRLGQNIECMWCHVAVPHGWKNKALLVNLNDVGLEAGIDPPQEIASDSAADVYNQQPYYFNAKLKIVRFRASGTWRIQDCGSAGANIPGNNTTSGREWMRDVCEVPP